MTSKPTVIPAGRGRVSHWEDVRTICAFESQMAGDLGKADGSCWSDECSLWDMNGYMATRMSNQQEYRGDNV